MTKGQMVLSKTFSASWLMAVIVTLCASTVTVWAVARDSKYADTILAVYFTNWGIIITNYFKRDRSQDGLKSTETNTADTKST